MTPDEAFAEESYLNMLGHTFKSLTLNMNLF